jgi:hypothetical protein
MWVHVELFHIISVIVIFFFSGIFSGGLLSYLAYGPQTPKKRKKKKEGNKKKSWKNYIHDEWMTDKLIIVSVLP